MDPSSRHQVWSLLKSRRAGRVIVLCTHYMDEADILAGTGYLLILLHFLEMLKSEQSSENLSNVAASADRKAVISQGLLKCIGSSLYLKLKCGVGYHLRQGDFVSRLHHN